MSVLKNSIALVTATLAAAALPTLIVVAIVFSIAHEEITNEEWWITLATLFAFAMAQVVLLGLPVAAVLRRIGRTGVVPVALAGLIVGVVPYAIYSFPFDAASRAEPWVMGWLEELAVFGVLGVLGAMAFLLVYRVMTRERGQPVTA